MRLETLINFWLRRRVEFYAKGLPQLEKVLEVLSDANKNLLTPSEALMLPDWMAAGNNDTLSVVASASIDNVFAAIRGAHGGLFGGLQSSVDNLRGGCALKPCDHDNRNGWHTLCLTRTYDDDSDVPTFVKSESVESKTDIFLPSALTDDLTKSIAFQNLRWLLGNKCEGEVPLSESYRGDKLDTARKAMLAVAANPQINLTGGNNNRCLHKYLIHASDYDPRVYEAFLSILASHLQATLTVYGLCSPLLNDTDYDRDMIEPKMNRTLEVISLVVPRVHSVLREDISQSEDLKMARGAVDSPHDYRLRTPWMNDYADPLPDTYKEIYGVFGREIEYRLGYWLPNNTYNVVIYYADRGNESQCIDQRSDDDFYRQNYRNLNYYVSYTSPNETDDVWDELGGAIETIKEAFIASNKSDLCERIDDVRNGLDSELQSKMEKTNLIAAKCAQEVNGTEHVYFAAVWGSPRAKVITIDDDQSDCYDLVFVP